MKKFLLLTLLLALAGPARAGDAVPLGAGEAAAIRSVIGAQLQAFQRDDGATAFSYASPTIKQKFGTVDDFMRMVQVGYPVVYRPREVAFLEALVKDGRTVQALRMVGPDGQAVTALYYMERQADGSWRINGVTLLRREETTS